MKFSNALIYLLKLIKWPKKLIGISLFISILGSLSGLLIPAFTGNIVDKLKDGNISTQFIIIFILLFIINAILNGVGLYILNKVGEIIIFSIRSLIWEKIVYLETRFFDINESGNIMSRITDDTKVINFFLSYKLPNFLPSLISIVGSLIMLFILDWQMTLVTLIIFPIYALIIIPLGTIMQKISINTQNEIANFSGLLGRVLTEIRLVKISSMEKEELKNAHNNLLHIFQLGLKQAKITSIIQPISSLVLLLTVGIILGFGGLKISNGSISAGTLVTMVFYVFQMSMPLVNVSTLVTDYKKAVGASSRIYEIINEKSENIKNNGLTFEGNKNLTFNNVTFAYKGCPVLENVSFTAYNNSTTAIVGPSGSGKSTIFQLIEQLYHVQKGQILYGEENINKFNLTSWRENIGYVTQDNPMMNGSIIDNVLYGNSKNIEMKDIEHYSKMANAHEFIKEFEDSYNTVVGERGVKLSGGQKQRIDIIRNFIKQPSILLLDEATSSLDSESEKKVQTSLERLMENRTTIVIAHRLSTIKKANQIIFLDKGKITGVGTHEQLIQNHHKYASFVSNQHLK
ncbi:ABC transporter ATP-binding protein [Staphylococcus pseudintermedius]|nr:ABC transporter ATP-binding protein [Staphylococcus pseudintermedius]MDE9887580.1 ABC transporter ATP-binding protein [Staphylococcus pseudintermedius]MDE9889858.1 ABC transporter ATP-binding protein [Staphylococcus pseudintermedius]MDE9892178.1 ABC transporter ATP-binding protein [Staphylococcus pseudintermedius]MDE9894442.1 ABC transporter ATP-binding protein [Staphylococcus pseudintermedius]